MILGDPATHAGGRSTASAASPSTSCFAVSRTRRPGRGWRLPIAPNRADVHRRPAAAPDLCRGRPHGLGDRRTLRRMGLPTDAIVGIQLPNIVENILTILGVLRAGHDRGADAAVVAPRRRGRGTGAARRQGADHLRSCRQFRIIASLAIRVAADVFSIRYVCGFGEDLPDGVVPFDDLFTTEKLDPIPPLDRERQCNAAALAADHLRHRRGRTCAGRAQSSRIARGRDVRLVRRPLSTLCKNTFDHRAGFVCRDQPHACALAPDRRYTDLAPCFRRRFVRRATARRTLRHADSAGAGHLPLRRDRALRRRKSGDHLGRMARAGPACRQFVMASTGHDAGRCRGFR